MRADVWRRMRERRRDTRAWKESWKLTGALANEIRRGYPSYPSLQSNGNLVRQAHAIDVRTTGNKGTSEAEKSRRAQIVSGSAYCFASAGMVLMNKLVLSSYDFHAPNALLFYQTTVCLALVLISKGTGMVKTEPLSLKIVKVWFPVNLIFVGMLWSSFISLQLVGVAMVTVLKNLANIITICGDTLFYNRRYNIKVWLSLFLMVVSAVCGSLTDLTFTSKGYVYQLLNCCFTAFYSLHLRSVMDKVKTVTTNKSSLSEFSMVYYNNLLSLPLMFLLAWYFGEIPGALQEPALGNPWFVCAATFSGVLGFGISFASLWFLSQTTATTYSLVGSLNKIPLAVLGILLFNTPTTISNLASIFLGLAAGVLFVRAKQTGVQK